MKKISLFGRSILTIVLLAIFATTTMAQTNPKPGYIITNNGDTIRGNIDFRTNEKLSKQCEFWANGGNEDTTYKPGDIEGFRFDNGGKYSEENSQITINTYVNNEMVVIEIKDMGIGISEEDLDKIFEKFTRLENHLTSKTQGNGLGLYITKNLVEGMNGQISVKSELNKGTEFTLRFPVYNDEEALKCSLQS